MRSIILFFKNMTAYKWFILTISPVLATLIEMKVMILALLFIIVIDMFTGIRKGLHNKKIPMNICKSAFWKHISSSGLRTTWRKTYEYTIGIIAFAVLDKMVLGGISIDLFDKVYSLTQIAIIIACFVEVYSVHENMEEVSGRNLFKSILHFLPYKFRQALSKDKPGDNQYERYNRYDSRGQKRTRRQRYTNDQ